MKRICGWMLLGVAVCCCLLLCGCTRRQVRSPADELCLYCWETETDNGNHMALRVEDTTASFLVENEAFRLEISGVCVLDDTTLMINDSETLKNYSFSYIVHGDSLELTYGGGTVQLDKKQRFR